MTADKPKILVLCHTALFGGAELVLERVVKAALGEGWSVMVVAPPGEAHERFESTGATVMTGPDLRLPAGPKSLGIAKRAVASVTAARLLRRTAREADLVVVNGVQALPALAIARLHTPSVWIVQQTIVSGPRLALVRLCMNRRLFPVAVSDAAAAPLRRLGITTQVVHNGTPLPPSVTGDEPPSDPVVGCAAALTGWKGQSVLLEAMALLDGRITLELVGERLPKDAAYEEALRARAREPDLAGRVRFMGFRTDVLDIVRTWTVAVSASVDPEACPLAPLEAMSVGVPVVGTDHGGTPEVLGDAGLLVPPGDPRALADAIDTVVSDKETWRRCHRAGLERVRTSFDFDNQLKVMLECLSHISRNGST